MIVDLLFVASSDRGARVLVGLARACRTRGAKWGCFLTGDGVRLLGDADVRSELKGATRVVACEHSWKRLMQATLCPVELGSQTDHSALVANAARVLTL